MKRIKPTSTAMGWIRNGFEFPCKPAPMDPKPLTMDELTYRTLGRLLGLLDIMGEDDKHGEVDFQKRYERMQEITAEYNAELERLKKESAGPGGAQ